MFQMILAVWLLLLGSRDCLAAGLSTSFGEILIENLQIGRTYNTKELINLPLLVRNTMSEPIELEMVVRKPSPGEKKTGFEPIPDLSWIRLEKSSHVVLPGQEAVSNVYITIPKDPKLKGRRFFVQLESHTIPPKKPGAALSVGIGSRLLFTVSTVEGSLTGGETARVFSVQPDDLFLPGVKTGRRVHSGDAFGKSLKVINANNFSAEYEIASIAVSGSKTKVRKGFEEAPDPKFISFDEDAFKIPPQGDKTVFFAVNIPHDPRYLGKNYMFLIETIQRTGTPRIKVYSRIFVFTEE
jgi:hypothetical protein